MVKPDDGWEIEVHETKVCGYKMRFCS